jgi:hypothetical protein
MHGSKHVVELAIDHAAGCPATEHLIEDIPDDGEIVHELKAGDRLARIGNAPAHEQHEEKTEEQEQQATDGILNADGLVICGEDVFLDEPWFMVVMRVIVGVIVSVGSGAHRIGVKGSEDQEIDKEENVVSKFGRFRERKFLADRKDKKPRAEKRH